MTSNPLPLAATVDHAFLIFTADSTADYAKPIVLLSLLAVKRIAMNAFFRVDNALKD